MTAMRVWSTLGLLVFAGACGGDSLQAPVVTANVAGTYAVEQVNGMPLPFIQQKLNGGHTELVSGELLLAANGAFIETGAVRLVAGTVTNTNTTRATGTYTVQGQVVRLAYDNGGQVATARAGDGGTLLVTAATLTVLYRRK